MPATPESHVSRSAWLSLLLGPTGPPAVWLGYRSLYAINASEGRVRGRPLALAGMAVGGVVTVLFVVGCVALVVLRSRENSNRTACAENLRSLGEAVTTYQDQKPGTFPAATVPNPALTPEQRLSWCVAILPLLDVPKDAKADAKPRWGPLYDRIDLGRAWDAEVNAEAVRTNVPRFLCRGHVAHDPQAEPGWTDYVGLAGVGLDAARLPKTNPRIGAFGYDRTLRPADVKAGLSYTNMVTETGQDNGPWAAGGPFTTRGLDPDVSRYVGLDRPFGGFHPGGLNVLRMDGSVHFVSDNVEPALFRSMSQIRRGP
jgi:hypothetical protein